MAKSIKGGTVKATLRPSRDKIHASVIVRYIYASGNTPFALGIILKPSQFDSKKQLVISNYPNSAEINKQIIQLKADLMNISNILVERCVEPTPQLVKSEYEQLLVDRKNKLVKERVAIKAKNLLGVFAEEDLQKIDEQVEQLQTEKKTVLSELERLGLNVNVTYTDDAKRFRALIYEYILEVTKHPLTATKHEIAEAVKKGTPRLTDTGRQKRSWANIVLEFFKSKEFIDSELPLSLNTLNLKFYNTYALYLMNPDGNDLYNNAFGSHIKRFKAFLTWVEDEKEIQIDQRYKKWKKLTEEKEIITLTEQEIDLLWNEPINHPQRKTIDLMVFGVLTSLRISDIQACKGYYIEDGLLRGKTTKTGGNIMIPVDLDERIMVILERYNWNLKLWSEQEFNKQIKDVMFDLYVKHRIPRKVIDITRKKLDVKITKPFYKEQLLTAHSLRRTFVTRMYRGATGRKWRELEIMQMMGSTDIKEFRKYLKIDAGNLVEDAQQAKQATIELTA